MNDRDQRRYNRATRVQTFGRANAGDFGSAAKASAHFANVDALIIALEDGQGRVARPTRGL